MYKKPEDNPLTLFLKDFYEVAWGHGTADQIMMRPDDFFKRYQDLFYDMTKDRTVTCRCPDCKYEWERKIVLDI